MTEILSLKPERLWFYFNEISKIPRTSLDEERVIAYIADIADKLGLENKKDSVNNLIVYKRAENNNAKNILTIQSHVDMVGVKNSNIEHDFKKDPIKIYFEDGFVKANGTTLGADNGIGVAMMMALMEETFENIDLEFLFTINEEAGMTGARNLNEDFVQGRMLLNLDSEEWGYVYVSCAGASDSIVSFSKGDPVSYEDRIPLEISIDNLLGGHSGIEIHSGKRNANKLLARILRKLSTEVELAIHSISGGTKRNAIPSSSKAVLFIKENEKVKAKEIIDEYLKIFKTEFGEIEKKFSINTKEMKMDKKEGMSIERSAVLCRMLMAMPHGVLAMSPSIEGLVETSINMGVIENNETDIAIRSLTRSSIDTSIEEVNDRIKAITELSDASIEIIPGYPGWKPNLDSKLLNKIKGVYNGLYNKDPEIMAIHAGLETAIIGKKFDNMDMVSIGPDLFHPHSPDEKVSVETVEKLYHFTIELIKSI